MDEKKSNLEYWREWVSVCSFPYPSVWYGMFGLMWLRVGHSPQCILCLQTTPALAVAVSLIWFLFWCGHVLKILTNGFHNKKKKDLLSSLRAGKKMKEWWVCVVRIRPNHPEKILTSKMFLVCCVWCLWWGLQLKIVNVPCLKDVYKGKLYLMYRVGYFISEICIWACSVKPCFVCFLLFILAAIQFGDWQYDS